MGIQVIKNSSEEIKQHLLESPKFYYSGGSKNILTDEASQSIKDGLEKIKDPYESRKFVKDKLSKFFKNTYKEETVISFGGEKGIRASIGDTRTTINLEASSFYDADSIRGIWSTIILYSLDLVLGLTTEVSWILTTVVAAVGISADTQAIAEARNMYNYRWAPLYGEVYYDDYYKGLGWYDRACSVTRQVFEHGWGYYFDENAIGHQEIVDSSYAKLTEYSPHWWDDSWMEAKAYNQWYYQLPYYYEDWND